MFYLLFVLLFLDILLWYMISILDDIRVV